MRYEQWEFDTLVAKMPAAEGACVGNYLCSSPLGVLLRGSPQQRATARRRATRLLYFFKASGLVDFKEHMSKKGDRVRKREWFRVAVDPVPDTPANEVQSFGIDPAPAGGDVTIHSLLQQGTGSVEVVGQLGVPEFFCVVCGQKTVAGPIFPPTCSAPCLAAYIQKHGLSYRGLGGEEHVVPGDQLDVTVIHDEVRIGWKHSPGEPSR